MWPMRCPVVCIFICISFSIDWQPFCSYRPPGSSSAGSLCISAIHQSYLLFNELISFNLFAQVSVAITGAVQETPWPEPEHSFKLQLSSIKASNPASQLLLFSFPSGDTSIPLNLSRCAIFGLLFFFWPPYSRLVRGLRQLFGAFGDVRFQ